MPRCYGAVLFRYQPALLLQFIDGVHLDEWFAPNKSTTTNLISIDSTTSQLSADHNETDTQQIELSSIADKIVEITRMLNSCGVTGDFKSGNIICRKDTVIIMDFHVSDEDSEFWVHTENQGGLRELFKNLSSSKGIGQDILD